jgi:hypothetical protein
VSAVGIAAVPERLDLTGVDTEPLAGLADEHLRGECLDTIDGALAVYGEAIPPAAWAILTGLRTAVAGYSAAELGEWADAVRTVRAAAGVTR